MSPLYGDKGFPDGSAGKESASNTGDTGNEGSVSGLRRFPRGGKWQPTPVFLPGKSYGPRVAKSWT